MWGYEEILKHFLPRDGVIYTYVIENADKQVTGFFSFYSLPSTILHTEKYDTLNAAYAYYMVPGEHSLKDVMKDMLIIANNQGFDVFNCLDIMNNEEVFDDLLFGAGDGTLSYYLYNWRLKGQKIGQDEVGMILV